MEEKIKNDSYERSDIYSQAIRAGKRTYFFDVKATKQQDLYLTITESKKRFDEEGNFHFEKHKIFLYKEDFAKFTDGFTAAIDYIRANVEQVDNELVAVDETVDMSHSFADIDYDNLKM